MSYISLLQAACASLYLLGSIFLLLRSRGSRSRKLLGTLCLINSINVFTRVVTIPDQLESLNQYVFDPLLITAGTFAGLILLLYVLEVIRPGWVGWKNGFLVLSPFLFLTVAYRLVLLLLGEPIRNLSDMSDMMAHIGEFNVWFRFVLAMGCFGYVIALNWSMSHYRTYYDQWCDANFANCEKMDISWVKYFGWGLFFVTLLYYGIMFRMGNLVIIAHQIGTLLVFGYLIYHALFHESPYPETFFAETMDEVKAEAAYRAHTPQEALVETDALFLTHLPGYVRKVEEWFAVEKPYLRKDFSLTDVAEILPLNRTYLSRTFNEGFGNNFSVIVQGFRVEYAKQLMAKQPDLTMNTLMSRSGFLTASNFYRAFQQHTGMTPGQYRDQLPTKPLVSCPHAP